MNTEADKKLKKLAHTLKILDFTDDDIQRVLKIDKKTIRRKIKGINIIYD